MNLYKRLKEKKKDFKAFKASIKSSTKMTYVSNGKTILVIFSKFVYCLIIDSILVFDIILLKLINLLLCFVTILNRDYRPKKDKMVWANPLFDPSSL